MTDDQILALAVQGYSPHDMAYRSGEDVRTIRAAVRRICRRLRARSLDHAIQIHQTSQEQQ